MIFKHHKISKFVKKKLFFDVFTHKISILKQFNFFAHSTAHTTHFKGDLPISEWKDQNLSFPISQILPSEILFCMMLRVCGFDDDIRNRKA